MTSDIQIYVSDLAAYNAGLLRGAWIDATQDVDDIRDEINTMLIASPIENAEEYAIHDYEGFEGYKLSEYEGIENVHNIACFIEEHGKLAAILLDYYELDAAKATLENDYHGCFECVADFARQLTGATTDIPEHLEFYIDYEKMGRDMELSGDIFVIETAHDEFHIF